LTASSDDQDEKLLLGMRRKSGFDMKLRKREREASSKFSEQRQLYSLLCIEHNVTTVGMKFHDMTKKRERQTNDKRAHDTFCKVYTFGEQLLRVCVAISAC